MALSDDEAITLAVLHGAEMAQGYWGPLWNIKSDLWHPIEEHQRNLNGNWKGFETRGALSQAYCRYHGFAEKVT
jgi:hypothetical protein